MQDNILGSRKFVSRHMHVIVNSHTQCVTHAPVKLRGYDLN